MGVTWSCIDFTQQVLERLTWSLLLLKSAAITYRPRRGSSCKPMCPSRERDGCWRIQPIRVEIRKETQRSEQQVSETARRAYFIARTNLGGSNSLPLIQWAVSRLRHSVLINTTTTSEFFLENGRSNLRHADFNILFKDEFLVRGVRG